MITSTAYHNNVIGSKGSKIVRLHLILHLGGSHVDCSVRLRKDKFKKCSYGTPNCDLNIESY